LNTEELEALDPLHCSPVDVGVIALPFPVVHDQVLGLIDVDG
jgi:hypothetical protein